MTKHTFNKQMALDVPASFAFQWHENPGAFERLTPPWEKVRVVEKTGGISDGDRVQIQMSIGPFKKKWQILHKDYIPNRQFKDIQVTGPFAHWEHSHLFDPTGEDTCRLEDRIEYRLPLAFLSDLLVHRAVQKKLFQLFQYRHHITHDDLNMHYRYRNQGAKNILVSGSSGLVGSSLIPYLTTGGHHVSRLLRDHSLASPGDVVWNPSGNSIDIHSLEGFDAVIHLAGENIAGRWTRSKKDRIRKSRMQGTRLLCKALASLAHPPQVLIGASAIGFYSDRGDEVLEETSPPHDDFLATVCQAWEESTHIASQHGIRVVNLRIGVVLTPQGGALAQMLLPFRMGVGGRIGRGNQYMSWISIDDLLDAILHCMMNDSLAGPVNAVSPTPVTNAEFTQTLGHVLHRPTPFPIPKVMIKAMLGEMGKALLLSSTRVHPSRLWETGFRFRHPNLEMALRHLLGKAIPASDTREGEPLFKDGD